MSTNTVQDEQTLRAIHDVLAEQPPAVQKQIIWAAGELRNIVGLYGQREPGAGLIALALVGAEAQLGMLQG